MRARAAPFSAPEEVHSARRSPALSVVQAQQRKPQSIYRMSAHLPSSQRHRCPQHTPPLPLSCAASSSSGLAITDEASPFALRSTRPHTLVFTLPVVSSPGHHHPARRLTGVGVHAWTAVQGPCQNLPETALHATSRHPTPRFPAAPFTWAVVWPREVVAGVVNHPSIDGKDAVTQSALRPATRSQPLRSLGRPLSPVDHR
jgi:hypothetical protein